MKKRVLSFLLCLVLVASVLPQVASAATVVTSGKCGDNVSWTLLKSGTLRLSGTGDMYDYTREASADGGRGVSVTADVSPWSASRMNIKKVIIDEGVTSIGQSAFYACYALSDIEIPDSVTSIADSAFYECVLLNVIDIPKSVTQIGNYAFYGCTSLESVNIPKSVTQIGDYAFYGCTSLLNINMPDGITQIGNNAFRNCKDLLSVTIPKSVTTMGVYVFENCNSVVIYCTEDSVAHKYAVDNKIRYQLIEDKDSSSNASAKDEENSSNTPANSNMTFADVPTNAWYYADLKSAYDAGIINGKTANEFKPNDNMTYAEAIKLAACLHQKVTMGKVTLTNGNPWYQSYVDYCKAYGIIDRDYNYNAPASRGGYMMIFANALPDSNLAEINKVDDNSIPDVKMTSTFASAVYKLYRAGIVGGSDAARNCKPNDNIKRSEVATILARMMFADKRIAFTLEKGEDVQPTGLRLDYNKTTLAVGEVDYWSATVYPEDAVTTITWESGNTTVATVDQNGKVTAISPGEARITVITENGLKEAITVTVVTK